VRGLAAPSLSRSYALRDFKYTWRKLRKCLHIYIADTGRCGLGIFAARPFRQDEVVMIDVDGDYYDQVLSYRELIEHGYDIKHTLQVGKDAFKLPTGSIDDFTNHSCDPNTGIRLIEKGTIIVAVRDIAVHEELTYDYSTYLNNPYETLPCLCGAASCRGMIGNFATLPADLQKKYLALGVVGTFARQPPAAGGWGG
jgi:uncharacterized protein